MIRKTIKCICEEYWLIENYEQAINDDTQMWDCHHRFEIDENGKTQYSGKDLIEKGLYYNRPAEELIFLTKSEHSLLHNKGENHPLYNKHHTEETKKKIGEGNKGHHHTEESKKKISVSKKGENHPLYGKHHTEESKKKMSESLKGENSHWYGKHFSEEHKRKLAEANKAYWQKRKKETKNDSIELF